MGLGVQGGGVGAVRYFAKHGATVTVTDLRTAEELHDSVRTLADIDNITYTLGRHDESDFASTELIVKGPSVHWDNHFIKYAQDRGITIIMETSYFAQHTKAIVIGVTGTRGKSTTSVWIYETLKKLYTNGTVYLAGNIPQTSALSLLDDATARDIVVLELSSWQLSGFHRAHISPPIAVFTNLYEDHLNYYIDMHSYLYDKTAIYAYQKPHDVLITTRSTLAHLEGSGTSLSSRVMTPDPDELGTKPIHAPGLHNAWNMTLAYEAVCAVVPQIDRRVIADTISQQSGILYRQQVVFDDDGTTIVNDATSSTPVALITALETFADRQMVLVMGGNSKRLSTHALVEKIRTMRQRIVKIFLLKGTMTDEILSQLADIPDLEVSTVYQDFDTAIQDATRYASQCDREICLLFSPGATSFAQFRNEFERGARFDQLISAIMKK